MEMVSAVDAVALMVRVATREVLFAVAVICADVAELTCLVLMEKLAVLAPAATVTLAGTLAAALLLANCTVTAVVALVLNVTVAVDALPPVTELGFNVSADNVGAAGGTVPPLVLSKTSPFAAASAGRKAAR